MISNNVYYLSNVSMYKFYGLEKVRAEATAECDREGEGRNQKWWPIIHPNHWQQTWDTRRRDKFSNFFPRAVKPNLMTEINCATLFVFHGLKWMDHLVTACGCGYMNIGVLLCVYFCVWWHWWIEYSFESHLLLSLSNHCVATKLFS